jgi:Holliday junction resolvasome RuvABC endonuclease subunit
MMGIDASLLSTGIASPDGTTLNIPDLNMRGWERISYIIRFVNAMVKHDKPTHICMEGYAMRASGRVFDIAELGGVMKLLFLSAGLPIILVPPKTLKVYAADNGNASKALVMKEIKARWGRSFVQSDRADAFALQQYGLDFLRDSKESVGEVRALGKAEIIQPKESVGVAIVCNKAVDNETDIPHI